MVTSASSDALEQELKEGGGERRMTISSGEQGAELVRLDRPRRVGVGVEKVTVLLVDADEQLVELVEANLGVTVAVVLLQEQAYCLRVKLRVLLALAQSLPQLRFVNVSVAVVVDFVKQAFQVLGLIPPLFRRLVKVLSIRQY